MFSKHSKQQRHFATTFQENIIVESKTVKILANPAAIIRLIIKIKAHCSLVNTSYLVLVFYTFLSLPQSHSIKMCANRHSKAEIR